MSDNIDYQIIKNFGPSIFKTKIPKNILDYLNNHTDKLLNDQDAQKNMIMEII